MTAVLVLTVFLVATEPQPVIILGKSWGGGPNTYRNNTYLLVGGELSNTGGADGYAVVDWVINRAVVQQVRYLVPAHTTLPIMLSLAWYQFEVYESYLDLLAVQRA